MKKQTLSVTGMTCAACAKAIERASKKLDGVSEAAVNFATEKFSGVSQVNAKTALKQVVLILMGCLLLFDI